MNQIIDRYRKIPDAWAFVAATVISFGLATVAGFFGGFAAMYLYDRGRSKGDDLAVVMSGLFAVATFTFVIGFTWLRKLHHDISARTPLLAWLICLAATAATTTLLWDRDYEGFILVGLALILFCGLGALILCRRMLVRLPAAIPDSAGSAPK